MPVSAICRTALQFKALQLVLQGMNEDELEPPDLLLERRAALFMRLVAMPATSGTELALKAHVLLDWVQGDDFPGKLTLSLCRDAVKIFPIDEPSLGLAMSC